MIERKLWSGSPTLKHKYNTVYLPCTCILRLYLMRRDMPTSESRLIVGRIPCSTDFTCLGLPYKVLIRLFSFEHVWNGKRLLGLVKRVVHNNAQQTSIGNLYDFVCVPKRSRNRYFEVLRYSEVSYHGTEAFHFRTSPVYVFHVCVSFRAGEASRQFALAV